MQAAALSLVVYQLRRPRSRAANEAMCRLLDSGGNDQGACLGRDLATEFRHGLVGRCAHRERLFKKTDGKPVHLGITVTAFHTQPGNVLHLLVIAAEFGEPRRNASAHEDRYREMFEYAVEGLFQTSPEGHYLLGNSAMARMFGYDDFEHLKKGLTDIGRQLYVDPHRRNEFIRLMAEHGEVHNFVSEIYRRDGETLWIEEKCRAVRDADGGILFYEGMVEDITERKRIEETAEHDFILHEMDCTHAQGWFYSRASNAEDVMQFVSILHRRKSFEGYGI